ncbi:MAG: molybdopterin-dependent oxidoreductase [Planctomycetota bacterium]
MSNVKQDVKSTRREFMNTALKVGSVAAVGTAVAGAASEALAGAPDADVGKYHKPEDYIHTVCLGCNTGCPSKIMLRDGKAVKIVGNPYAPWTKSPHLDYKTSLNDALPQEGALCPKGEAGIMTVYDKYRLKKILKRAGPRGSNKWVTMDFHKAVEEIVNGGKLFANVPGEENRTVEGLKDLWALKDSKVMGEMDKFIKDEIWKAKTPEDKSKKVSEFKEKFKDYLHTLIDPEHPDMGPKNNQFIWIHGRLKAGRQDFFDRFVKGGMGSGNFHGHTTVCQGSLYFTGKAMSYQYAFDEAKKKADWGGEKKFYWQCDLQNAKFVIFVGASPFEANYGPPYRAPKITDGLTSGRLKYAVIDPRFSKTAAHAWKWLPAKPGSEGAFALAMIRWVLDNSKYDKKYLENANKAASKEDKEPNWTNACWLVKIKDGHSAEFLRASDIGLPKEARTVTIKKKDGTEEAVNYEFDPFIVLRDNKPVPFDPEDEKNAVHGDLLVNTTVTPETKPDQAHPSVGVAVKSGLQLLLEESQKYTIEEWAKICDVTSKDIEELAKEFTSYGKQACADIHRGVSQHSNGFYNVLAWNSLNLLIGNYDWQGGFTVASTYDITGGKAKGPFNIGSLHPNKLKPFGINILRHAKYEDTTLFAGYPAKRPWHTHATDVYQELLPSVADAYPYPVKALLLYMGTPVYALPAGQVNLQALANVNKLPLFVASDIVVGTSSMFADYIIPDISYLERWEFHGSHPSVTWKVQPVRQPTIPPQTDLVKVFGEEMPICLESFMLAVAEKMGLPGFGPDGLDKGVGLTKPDDFYVRMVANIAFGEKADGSGAVPDASDEEVAVFFKARQHLPKSVFDPERWQKIAGPNWKKVVYVLNRGGRFQDYKDAFDGKQLKNKYGKLINMYSEKIAKIKNSMTGKYFYGGATYLPIVDSVGNPVKHKEGDLHLITYREIFHTKSRTATNLWLLELHPENHFLLNSRDAQRLGINDGDTVKVVSDSNPEGVWDLPNFRKIPMSGKAKVIEGIRAGVVAFSLGHGNWGYNAYDTEIDGQVLKGEPHRGKGVHANAAMMIDPHLKNVSLQDLVGGSVCFYDSPVRLVKA